MPSTLATPVHSELVIKKSRFIGCVEPMSDRVSAVARVAALKAELKQQGKVAFPVSECRRCHSKSKPGAAAPEAKP